MKLISILAALALAAVFTLPVFPQTTHTVQLTWTASTDTGGTVNVYRAPVACSTNPATSAFTQIKTGVVAAGPYSDATVTVGSYCYYITAVVNGAESAASNKASVSVLPQAPTGLVVTITQ